MLLCGVSGLGYERISTSPCKYGSLKIPKLFNPRSFP